VVLVDPDVTRAGGEEVGVVEATGAFEDAGDARLLEERLEHLGFGLVAGEADLDQLAAAPAAASTTTVVAVTAAAVMGAARVGAPMFRLLSHY
jgi:hypothetical protein